MKKFIITLKEESELLESIITLLESNEIIEVEEVQSSKKPNFNCIKVIAIDIETEEELEFDSIQQASEFIGCSPSKMASKLNSKESFCGYYWYKVRESKHSKLKI